MKIGVPSHSELFWSVFPRIRTEYGEVRVSPWSECGEMRTRIIPITDTFHAVFSILIVPFHIWHIDSLIFWKLECIRVLVDNVWKSKTELLSKLPHRIKFVRILVFSDPYFPVLRKNLQFLNIQRENANHWNSIYWHFWKGVFLKWVMIK